MNQVRSKVRERSEMVRLGLISTVRQITNGMSVLEPSL